MADEEKFEHKLYNKIHKSKRTIADIAKELKVLEKDLSRMMYGSLPPTKAVSEFVDGKTGNTAAMVLSTAADWECRRGYVKVFGRNLEATLIESCVTLPRLAHALRVSSSLPASWIKGQYMPSKDSLKKILTLLKVSEDTLFKGVPVEWRGVLAVDKPSKSDTKTGIPMPNKRELITGTRRELVCTSVRKLLTSLSSSYREADIAFGVGVSKSLIGFWKSGEHCPSLDRLEKLAVFAGVDLNDLLFGKITPLQNHNSSGPSRLSAADVPRVKLEIVSRLQKLLLDQGLSYNALDLKLGVGNGVTSAWMRGKRIPPTNLWAKIAKALSTTEEELFAGLPSPTEIDMVIRTRTDLSTKSLREADIAARTEADLLIHQERAAIKAKVRQTLSSRIDEARRVWKFSLAELGALAGINGAVVSCVRLQRWNSSDRIIQNLAKGFGMTVGDFLNPDVALPAIPPGNNQLEEVADAILVLKENPVRPTTSNDLPPAITPAMFEDRLKEAFKAMATELILKINELVNSVGLENYVNDVVVIPLEVAAIPIPVRELIGKQYLKAGWRGYAFDDCTKVGNFPASASPASPAILLTK